MKYFLGFNPAQMSLRQRVFNLTQILKPFCDNYQIRVSVLAVQLNVFQKDDHALRYLKYCREEEKLFTKELWPDLNFTTEDDSNPLILKEIAELEKELPEFVRCYIKYEDLFM